MQPLLSNDTILQFSLYGLFVCLLLELVPYIKEKIELRNRSNRRPVKIDLTDSVVKGSSNPTIEASSTENSSSDSSNSSSRSSGSNEEDSALQPIVWDAPINEDVELTAEELSKEHRFSQLIAMNLGNVDGTVESIQQMQRTFPDESVTTILRFLIARKGNVKLATEMLETSRKWRAENLPVDVSLVAPAFKSKCMFIHGNALDGTPALYFRGSLYDKNSASCESYVFASVLTIETALQSGGIGGGPSESITVLVHTSLIPGAPNASADISFIKAFVKVLSDNFPERLNKLIIYPFPFFGRAIWMVVKPFLDTRTADKVVLIPGGDYELDNTLPAELLKYVDPKTVPKVCGGQNLDPIKYIM